MRFECPFNSLVSLINACMLSVVISKLSYLPHKDLPPQSRRCTSELNQ